MFISFPESKVHGANMDPGGPHVGPMNLVTWIIIQVQGPTFISIK